MTRAAPPSDDGSDGERESGYAASELRTSAGGASPSRAAGSSAAAAAVAAPPPPPPARALRRRPPPPGLRAVEAQHLALDRVLRVQQALLARVHPLLLEALALALRFRRSVASLRVAPPHLLPQLEHAVVAHAPLLEERDRGAGLVDRVRATRAARRAAAVAARRAAAAAAASGPQRRQGFSPSDFQIPSEYIYSARITSS